MKVLVACEESQEVCKAFREREHEGEFKERITYNIRLCREVNTHDT